MKVDLEDALASLQEAREADMDEVVANALFKVAMAYIQRAKWAEADENLDEAQYLCGRLENWSGLNLVCFRRAEVALGRGDWQTALKHLDQAVEAWQKTDPKDEGLQVSMMEMRAKALQQGGRLEDALAGFGRVLDIVTEKEDEVSQLLMSQAMAPIQRQLGQLDEALKSYQRMGSLAHTINDPQRIALALVGVGSCHYSLGRREVGLAALRQARESFAELGQMTRAKQVQEEIDRLIGLESQA